MLYDHMMGIAEEQQNQQRNMQFDTISTALQVRIANTNSYYMVLEIEIAEEFSLTSMMLNGCETRKTKRTEYSRIF